MGKYDRWAAFFEDLEGARHEIPLEVLGELVDGGLPPTAEREKAWWSGEHYYAWWKRSGWYASLQPKDSTVVFSKTPFSRGRPATVATGSRSSPSAASGPLAAPPSSERLVLVGCVAQKRPMAAPARDLYVSALWGKRRRYAESTGMPWFVLSAEYGLVDPDDVLEPYDRFMDREPRAYRARWSEVAAARVVERCRDLTVSSVEVHAGSAYLEYGLIDALQRAGIAVDWPLRGYRIGEQLNWYDSVASIDVPVARPVLGPVPAADVTRASPTGGHASSVAEIYRSGVLGESWADLPEVWAQPDADPTSRRLWLTFVAAVDRARDAAALWRAAHDAWAVDRWLFDPDAVARRLFSELADTLRLHGLSQRHMPDTAAWRSIAEALVSPQCPPPIRDAVSGTPTPAPSVLRGLEATWPHGTPMFPQLSGPKIGPMWVRMLVYPGGSPISGLDVIPVAVDTHVQRVTEMLGLVAPQPLDDAHRQRIQAVWFAAVEQAGMFGGPAALDGTSAGLDPALWALGRVACSRCESQSRKIVVGAVCELCVLGRVRAATHAEQRPDVTSPWPAPAMPPA